MPPQERRYVYSARTSNFSNMNSYVTINFNDRHKTAFTLPIGVVRDFIYPFAAALNFALPPPHKSTQSQTSYLNTQRALRTAATQHREESESDGNRDITTDEDFSDFEYNILRKLRCNLVNDITKARLIKSDSDLSTETEKALLEKEPAIKVDQKVENLIDVQVADEAIEDVPLDANNNNRPLLMNSHINGGSTTADEGFDDTSNGFKNKTETLAFPEPSEIVLKMSNEIFAYLKEQCYEIKELVLFPEVLYDNNIQKLMSKLQALYEDHCSPDLPEEEKNELRIQVAAEVLTQLHLKDVSSASPEGSVVSDKVFSTSEFVSDILDTFFNHLTATTNENGFQNFKESLVCGNSEMSSTPDTKRNQRSDFYEDAVAAEAHEVTSFKRDVAQKTGSESFWIAISKTTPCGLPRSPSLPRKIINVDDIPLKPPPDFLNASSFFEKTKLSPIVEEARRSLVFDESDSSGGVDVMYEDIDVLAGGDNDDSCTYIAFERPEINVVCETTRFHRTNTINTTSYVTKSEVHFSRGSEISENSDGFEGDWMGFENAKF